MKISLSWLSDYIDTLALRRDLKTIVSQLAMRGVEIEQIEDLSKGFEKVTVAKIEACESHPNADKLSICQVNTGKETLQIVCGAKNMKAGDKVALAHIGADLPNKMHIEKTNIRNVESYGMLCSEVELGLGSESAGIMILQPDALIGQGLAAYLGRDDLLLDVNVSPNRGDILSHIGFAREVASLTGQKVKLPEAHLKESKQPTDSKIKIKLYNTKENPNLCLQYHGRYFENVTIAPSPDWLQKRLIAVGLKPINNIVDITNYVLMEWGTPLHAFDYSKIQGAQIQVRLAKKEEKIRLLDNTEVSLSENDLVIADTERPIALAGVMGGANSEVSSQTKAILLEAAQFSSSFVRKTSRRHQKLTDAAYRFERQIDSQAVALAMNRAAALFQELAGATVFKNTVSLYSEAGKKQAKDCTITISGTNKYLGLKLTKNDISGSLKSIGFIVKSLNKDQLKVSIPTYRPDVSLPVDLYEEILRVWGYDKVMPEVPGLHVIPEPTSTATIRMELIQKLKFALLENGFSESVNLSFTSKENIKTWGGPKANLAQLLENPLTEEFTMLKTSLIGGLFENLLTSFRHQQTDPRLFEIRPVYFHDETCENKTHEEWMVAGLMTGRSYTHVLTARDQNIDFFDAKGVVETALDTLGCKGLRYYVLDPNLDTRLHPAQAAVIALGKGPCGWVGRLHPKIEQQYKLKLPVFAFEFSLERALEVASKERKFSALPRFPKVLREFSLIIPGKMAAASVVQAVQKFGRPLVETISIVDVYTGEKVGLGNYSLSVSLIIGDPNRTLEEAEVELLSKKILAGLENQLGVRLRLQ